MELSKAKLYVVDLRHLSKSHYHNPETIGLWLLGRHLDNYIMFAVSHSDNRTTRKIPLTINNTLIIQHTVNTIINEFT
jgi:hypothetical protein